MGRKIYISLALLSAVILSFLSPVNAEAENLSPIPQSAEYETYRDVPVSGKLTAVDPDGDSILYSVSREPKKGTLSIDPEGSFVYTPQSGKSGRDSFSFIAVDSKGDVSVEATVNITIKRLKTDVFYQDMIGDDALIASLHLAENDIYTGRKVGECYYFDPDSLVTRGDFLVMCMKMCNIDELEGVTKTGFSDDESISAWLKPYVSAGLLNGIISGCGDESGIVFYPDRAITLAEASVTLNNAMELNDVYVGAVNDTCPVWAVQASANLNALDIDTGDDYIAAVTMRDAAKMLYDAAKILGYR